MQGTKWKKFDENRFLGEPPTEAYQLSQICTAAARRGQMALRAERRNDVSNTETCKQGCGRTSIPVAQLQRHHLETCPCRVIICPRNGCSKMYQFRNMMDHYKTGKCIPYAYRQELLAKHAENESIVLCPLGCGISSLKRRQLKKHITKECCRRTVLCTKNGCGLSYPFEDQTLHESRDCQSPFLLEQRKHILRSRLRQTSVLGSTVVPYRRPTIVSSQYHFIGKDEKANFSKKV